jgi:hypothetical protein
VDGAEGKGPSWAANALSVKSLSSIRFEESGFSSSPVAMFRMRLAFTNISESLTRNTVRRATRPYHLIAAVEEMFWILVPFGP